MPTYEHICTDELCNNKWEESYSIKSNPPTNCPKCGKETVKRVIALTAHPVVLLTGQDLKDKIKADAQKLKKELATSENKLANFIGDDKYHASMKSV